MVERDASGVKVVFRHSISAATLLMGINKKACLAALVLGLFSSTFSSVVISLGSGRIGRDPLLDWMQVGTTYFGTDLISMQVNWWDVLAGLLVHQSSDILWAFTFFGLMWSVTRSLSPFAIILVTIPWAAVTAAIEYYLVLLWMQPVVPMQVPFWTAFAGHILSGLVYPLFPLVYFWIFKERRKGYSFSAFYSSLLLLAVAFSFGLYTYGKMYREVKWPFADISLNSPEAEFLFKMTHHHQIGKSLSSLAVNKSEDKDLVILSELMYAEHKAEIMLMKRWWLSWFQDSIPELSHTNYRDMTGMPPKELVNTLKQRKEDEFDKLFMKVMIRHHEGAIAMCYDILDNHKDARFLTLASSIKHSQEQQIEKMKDLLREKSESNAATIPFTW